MLRQVGQFTVHSSQFTAKDLCLCLLCAGMLILSFPGFNAEFLAWFAFVPLFFVLANKSKWQAFLFSYLTGVIFWSGTIYWLAHVTLLGTIILILYLALYFGIFGLIWQSTRAQEHKSTRILLIPAVWVLLEFARSHLLTGFPWALLGYSQYLNLPIIQIADITGAWGVSFLVMMANGFVKEVIGSRSWVVGKKTKVMGSRLWMVGCVLIFVLSLGYGYHRLYLQPITYDLQPAKISVIQGNIPQELKWDPKARGYILDKYSRLTEEAGKENPDLIIWPEAANPDVWGEGGARPEEILSLPQKGKVPLLLGTVLENEGQYFNSALLIDAKGKIISRYDKLHLVPFGEYIPLRKALPFLETVVPIGDVTRGKEYTLFEIPNPKSQIPNPNKERNFAVLICFEDLFPELSRAFVKKGAGFLVNITNDAWYKKTAAGFQHFQASVFRAVENRVFLARSANTGVSGFIGPQGKIVSLTRDKRGRNIFVAGTSTAEIAISKAPLSFYTLHGDIFILSLFIFVVFYGIFFFMRKMGVRFLK